MAEKGRVWTHILLALITAAICGLTILWLPESNLYNQLTIAMGYLSLALIAFTLIIGPWRILRAHSIPLNINYRRDVGIWAAITGVLHVIFGLQVHMGGRILLYFFKPGADGYRPLINLFGISNYIGAIATFILGLLLVISNDVSLRYLKRTRWKPLQQLNYLLFILVTGHTFGYQLIISRARALIGLAFGLALLVIAMQGVGFFLYRQRQLQ